MTIPSNANASVHTIVGHVFNDPALLVEALHAAGTYYQNAEGHFVLGNNKRLALLGDKVLALALVDDWYPQGGTTEDSSNIVQRFGANAKLCTIGRQIGLDNHIIAPASHFGAVSDKTMATTVEALLGAIFLDTGKDIDAVKPVIRALGLGPV